MAEESRDLLSRQFDIAWALTSYHLNELTTEECLWRPARAGLHLHLDDDGAWRADWPTHEGYDLGPPSIAWTTWHVDFWWSMLFDHSFGDGSLTREQVTWPGSADGVKVRITAHRDRWKDVLDRLTNRDLQSTERTRWPFADRPLADVVSWVNIELTKNAAEIGYGRFLHAVRSP